ncbi:MAG: glycosyltransferase family 2 protein [Pseudomonadota bacterium]
MTQILRRRLARLAGTDAIIEALPIDTGATRLFVKEKCDPDTVLPTAEIAAVDGIGGGLVIDVTSKLNIDASLREADLFVGKNVGVAVWQAEDPDNLRAWAMWHASRCGMTAALILCATPDLQVDDLIETVAAKPVAGLDLLMLVESDAPLGKSDLPLALHPFNAPDAPGKDRMSVPDPDRFRAPFGAFVLYEAMRQRFFGSARAAMNIDVCDFLAPAPTSVFDRAQSAASGVVPLVGQRVYPWALRKNKRAKFMDHICRPFDVRATHSRWCIAPARLPENAALRLVRVRDAPVSNPPQMYWRAMSLLFPETPVAQIVPKSSLIEVPDLVRLAEDIPGKAPLRPPAARFLAGPEPAPSEAHTTVVTCMKNEGPFILDWIAHNRAVGVSEHLVYTNDCTDGTDVFLDVLQRKGLVHHRTNPFRGTKMKPQHAALAAAAREDVVQSADWVAAIDVDEFLNIRVGDGRLEDLFEATRGANMISATWRLFGNGNIHRFEDVPVTEQFFDCAPEFIRKPHQAWGFKTLFRNIGIFRKLGVHRPKGLNTQHLSHLNWVNGSGKPMPKTMFRNAWRSTPESIGYDLVALNHYAVRSAESFLVKRDRGRVNHVDRDQGLNYWFRMNNNETRDTLIKRIAPAFRAERARLLADPDIAAAHATCVGNHRNMITRLKARPDYASFYAQLTSARMERLSRLHRHFGANVFLAGPDVIPDSLIEEEVAPDLFFTVPGTPPAA